MLLLGVRCVCVVRCAVCVCLCLCLVCGCWCVMWHAEKPPCVDSKRLRVYRQHARMCLNMRACCRFTRRRCERTHGEGGEGSAATHRHRTAHTQPQHIATHSNAQQHTTTHNNTQQHTETGTERERDREGKMEKQRQEKTADSWVPREIHGLPITHVCFEFLTTLTFRALCGNHIGSTPLETIAKTWNIERPVASLRP